MACSTSLKTFVRDLCSQRSTGAQAQLVHMLRQAVCSIATDRRRTLSQVWPVLQVRISQRKLSNARRMVPFQQLQHLWLALVAIGHCSGFAPEEDGQCFAVGGLVSAGQKRACAIPFYVETKVIYKGTAVIVGKTYSQCAQIQELHKPFQVSIDNDGVINGSTVLLEEPYLPATKTDFWCPTGAFYSNIDSNLRPIWGYCNCGENFEWPTLAPISAAPATNSPSFVPSTSNPESETPTQSPSSSSGGFCSTVAGPDKGKACVFPFDHNGQTFDECIAFAQEEVSRPFIDDNMELPDDYALNAGWCGTNSIYDSESPSGKLKWGICDCFTVGPTLSPTRVQPSKAPSYFSSSSPTSNPSSAPSFYPSQNDLSTLPTSFPSVAPTSKLISASPSTITPSGSPTGSCIAMATGYQEEEVPCVFPFVHDSREWTDCISFGDNSVENPFMNDIPQLPSRFAVEPDHFAWCAVSADYDESKRSKKRKWGFCGCLSPPPNSVPTDPCRSDGILNDDESDVDCGGNSCPACNLGQKCSTSLDCRGWLHCGKKSSCEVVHNLTYWERIRVPSELTFIHERIVEKFVQHAEGFVVNGKFGISVHVLPESIFNPPTCITDGGWAESGSSCVLPFEYDGLVHYECQLVTEILPYWGNETVAPRLAPPVLYGVKWCPTVSLYARKDIEIRESWGFCDCGETWPTKYPTSQPTGFTEEDPCEIEQRQVQQLNHFRETLESRMHFNSSAVFVNESPPEIVESFGNFSGDPVEIRIQILFEEADDETFALDRVEQTMEALLDAFITPVVSSCL